MTRSDSQRRLRAQQLEARGRAEQLAAELALVRHHIAQLSAHVVGMPEPDRRQLVELHARARTLLDGLIRQRYRVRDLEGEIVNVRV
jgi:hypothetical protein